MKLSFQAGKPLYLGEVSLELNCPAGVQDSRFLERTTLLATVTVVLHPSKLTVCQEWLMEPCPSDVYCM